VLLCVFGFWPTVHEGASGIAQFPVELLHCIVARTNNEETTIAA